MFENISQLGDLMKTLSNINEHLESVKKLEVKGISGGGKVEVTLTGDFSLKAIRIAEDCIKEGDHEIIEDLVTAAFNSAITEVKNKIKEKLGKNMGAPFISELFGA